MSGISRKMLQVDVGGGATVAYVAGNTNQGLNSIDISNPNILRQLDRFNPSGFDDYTGIALDLGNQVAYIIDPIDNTIASIDISDPKNLTLLDTYTSASLDNAGAIALDPINQVAYVTCSVPAILVFDISNPSNISLLSSFTGIEGTQGISLDLTNEVAYAGAPFTSIDISDPNNLTQLDTLGFGTGDSIALDVTNQVGYMIAGDTVVSVDISNPSNLIQLDGLGNSNLNDPEKIAIDQINQVLYVVSTGAGTVSEGTITSIDISNPSNLTRLDSLRNEDLNSPNGIALDLVNRLAYVVCQAPEPGNFICIDISDPENLTQFSKRVSNNYTYSRDIALNIPGPASTKAYG